tara:strand:+ start:64 stop:378 length:315 start_codon:yes stop_codon:yes gene_type:complete
MTIKLPKIGDKYRKKGTKEATHKLKLKGVRSRTHMHFALYLTSLDGKSEQVLYYQNIHSSLNYSKDFRKQEKAIHKKGFWNDDKAFETLIYLKSNNFEKYQPTK